MYQPTVQADKLRELVLLVAERARDEHYFGRVKLNKVLFYIDFRAYRDNGQAVTGAEYQRMDFGPVPRELRTVLDQMLQDKSAALREELVGSYTQSRVVPLREADTSVFSAEELNVIDSVLSEFRGLSGSRSSDLSHEEAGWRLAREGETIPYFTAYLMTPRLSEDDINFLRAEANRLSLVAVPA